MYAEGRATPSMGVSGALGKQADRRARSGGTLSRTDEPAKRARLANMARLSVAHAEVTALTIHGHENIRAVGPLNLPEVSCDQRLQFLSGVYTQY